MTDSSQELLDVVDADDRITGVATRGEIHRLGLMHRAVHILVFHTRGDLFLQKRSLNKDNNPGLWDSSAAGHVDSGEDYLVCARRELHEELGIEDTLVLECLFKLPPSPLTGMEHCRVYQCTHTGPFVLQTTEIDEGRWVSAMEMDQRVAENDPTITDSLKLIWQRRGERLAAASG